jgi:hypothetical protein
MSKPVSVVSGASLSPATRGGTRTTGRYDLLEVMEEIGESIQMDDFGGGANDLPPANVYFIRSCNRF